MSAVCVLDFVGTHYKYGYTSYGAYWYPDEKKVYFDGLYSCLEPMVSEEEPDEETVLEYAKRNQDVIDSFWQKIMEKSRA